MSKVNLEEGLSRFDDHWSPKIIADLNDYKVQLVTWMACGSIS